MITHLLAERSGEIINVARGALVSDAIALLARRRIGAVPVMDGDGVIGILSERDIIYRLSESGADILDWPVEKVMTAPVVTIERESSILAALGVMTQRRIRHLPVVENGRMIDFISIGDLVKARLGRIEAEAEALRDYIQSA